jgi:DNA-binding CsgD family transcriptional regulator
MIRRAGGGDGMTGTVDRLHQDLIDLTERSVPDPRTLRDLARTAVARLVPADDLFWCELDVGRGVAAIERADGLDRPMAERFAAVGADHPPVADYVRTGDRTPRRLSDVVSPTDWARSRAWRHLFAEQRARYQLSALVDLGPTVGRGWTVVRSGRDFSTDDVRTARAVQPLLEAVWRMGAASTLPPGARAEAPLTAREVDVLRLLSTGATATAIGWSTGIAYGTVRKHIEHVYEKLGVHDRMLAVRRAAELGYLTPTAAGITAGAGAVSATRSAGRPRPAR